MATIVCAHCRREVICNKKLKHLKQQYCGSSECQHMRRLCFARKKYQTNQDFRASKLKKAATKRKNNRSITSDYQRSYRAMHPAYSAGNRQKQRLRYEKKKQEKPLERKIVNPYTLMPQQADIELVYAMFEIDQKMIVNPYTLMLEHIDKLSFTNVKPILVRLL